MHVNGVDLEYVDEGAGVPVVFSHGGSSDLRWAGAAGDAASLWFELVNNRGPGTVDEQPAALRRMWLDNFPAIRPASPPPAPLRCSQLGSIAVPTLAVAAGYGMRYSRLIVDRLAACIPGCRLVVVPAVTHFMSYQEPDRFNETLLDRLATVTG